MFEPKPDYRRFVDTMWRREPDRVPIAEIGVDRPMKEKLLGKPVRDVKTDVEFWHQAGYDYIYLRPDYEFPYTIPPATSTGRPQYDTCLENAPKSESLVGPGVITRREDLDTYPWPDPENDVYYKPLREAVECLPPGMGLVSGVGGIFTRNTGRYGGALNTSGSLTVRNSVFNGNSALLGGAIHNKGAANSTLKLVSSSFAGNLAHISGGEVTVKEGHELVRSGPYRRIRRSCATAHSVYRLPGSAWTRRSSAPSTSRCLRRAFGGSPRD